MSTQYSLRQIKTAFFWYFRGGGELRFKDSWSGYEGSVLIDWEGFLEQLKKTEGRNETVGESF